ncbi:amidohydrolase [Labrys neptuniae]
MAAATYPDAKEFTMPSKADLLVFNGRAITMDPRQPHAQQAVAIAAGRIVAVGSNEALMALKGPDTVLVDARGGSILPGFNECHLHIFGGAAALSQLSLFGVKGLDALAAAITRFAAEQPDAPLLIGNSADYTLLGQGQALDRHVLDRILPGRPLLLFSPDHHTGWVNTAALQQAGIFHGRNLPQGNEIVMEPGGTASGELREPEAIKPVLALDGGREGLGIEGKEPPAGLSATQRNRDKATLLRGLDHCARHGITSFQNMDGNFYQLELLEELRQEGKLICRASVPFHFVPSMRLEDLEKASYMHETYRSDWLRSGRVKMFMDGVLDSWTAVMQDDYADKPGWRGEPRFEQDAFDAVVTEADRRGLQVAVHAIGDGAVHRTLNGYEAARRANGPRDSRHRIEHVELVLEEDIERFRRLGVTASFQPPHPPGQAGLPLEPTLSRIGRQNWWRAYAWNRFRETGVHIAFSSDWPVSAIDPMQSIHSAMTRKPWAEDQPDNRQTLQQALSGYLGDSAYCEFAEDRKGRLAEGYLGDVTVLDADLTAIEPEAIAQVTCTTTICGGRVTFQA